MTTSFVRVVNNPLVTSGTISTIDEIKEVDTVTTITNPVPIDSTTPINVNLSSASNNDTNSVYVRNTIGTPIYNEITTGYLENVAYVGYIELPVPIDDSTPINVNISSGTTAVSSIGFAPDPFLELLLGNYPNVTTDTLYARGVATTSYSTLFPFPSSPIILDLIPEPGIACAISYEHIAAPVDTTTEIVIEYYASNTTNILSTYTATLNDTTKVTIPGTIFRIKNIYVDPSSPIPTGSGNVYLFDDTLVPVLGVPATYFDMIRISSINAPDYGQTRQTAIYYVPPGLTAYGYNIVFTGGNQQGDATEIDFLTQPLGSSIAYTMALFPGTGLQQLFEPFYSLVGPITLHVILKEQIGTNVIPFSLTIDFVIYNP